jgi:hypothetical protein
MSHSTVPNEPDNPALMMKIMEDQWNDDLNRKIETLRKRPA